MKNIVIVSSFLLLFSGDVSNAQSKSQIDEAGRQFWTKFNAAVASGDKEAVASMTRLPFMFQGRELAKPDFIQKFDVIFTARVKQCFAKVRLLKEGDGFEVFCAKQIFLFDKVKG